MGLSNNDKASGNTFLIGLTLGAAVGFLSGVLFAPKAGNETRAIIMDTGREWK
jgi:gas vesicle protein